MELEDRLEVSVMSGEGLPEVAGGECNPFVVVRCGVESSTTVAVNGSSNPVWGRESTRSVFGDIVENSISELVLVAMHKDLSGARDEELGRASIKLQSALSAPGIELEEWHELSSPERQGPCGRVRVSVTYFVGDDVVLLAGESSSDEDDDEEGRRRAREGRSPNALVGEVRRGRRLTRSTGASSEASSSEARVTIRVGESKHRTRYSKGDWYGSKFRLPLAAPMVRVKAKGRRFGRDVEIGTCEISVVEIASAGGSMSKWCTLLGPGDIVGTDRGQVEIAIGWVYDRRMPPAKLSSFTAKKAQDDEEEDDDARKKKQASWVLRGEDVDGGGDDEDEEAQAAGRLTLKEREELASAREARDMMAEAALTARSEYERSGRPPAGAYRVVVDVIEARDLEPQDYGGTSDPYVKARLLGKTKKSRVISKIVGSCVFNEQISFDFDRLTSDQVESGVLSLTVMDYDYLSAHDVIGEIAIDLRAAHEREIYRKWFVLGTPEAAKGQLKVSVKVLAEGESIRPHDVEEDYRKEMLQDERRGGDGVVVLSEAAADEGGHHRSTGWLVVTCYAVQDHRYRVGTSLSAAELEAASQAESATWAVAVAFDGQRARSQAAPCELWLPATSMPGASSSSSSKIVEVELSSNKSRRRRRLPPQEVFARLDFENLPKRPQWVALYGAPLSTAKRGPRDADARRSTFLENKYGGSTYRGRLLVSARTTTSAPGRSSFLSSSAPSFVPHTAPLASSVARRRPATMTYSLRVLVVAGSEIPTLRRLAFLPSSASRRRTTTTRGGANDDDKAPSSSSSYCPMRIVVSFGPFTATTDLKAPSRGGVVEWTQLLQLPRVTDMPVVIDQLPDLCLTLERDGAPGRPLSFARIPAARLLATASHDEAARRRQQPFWTQLRREPATASYAAAETDPGSVLLQAALAPRDEAAELFATAAAPLAMVTTTRQDNEPADKTYGLDAGLVARLRSPEAFAPFCLRVYAYQARDLPPGDDDGLADAYVKVRFNGTKRKTKVAARTTAPLFYETLQFPNERLREDARYGPDVVVQVWDSDTLSPNSPVAKVHIPLAECVRLASESSPAPRPTWRPLLDVNGDPLNGGASLLVAAALIRKRELAEKIERPGDITPTMRPVFLECTLIGVRQLKAPGVLAPHPKAPYVRADVPAPNDRDAGFRTRPARPSPGARDRNARNANFCERRIIQVDLPENPLFAQRLDIRVFDKAVVPGTTRMLGACAIDLASKMPWNSDQYVPPTREPFYPPTTTAQDEDRKKKQQSDAEEKKKKKKASGDKDDELGDDVDDVFGSGVDESSGRRGAVSFKEDEEDDGLEDEEERLLLEGAEERQQFELERRGGSVRFSRDDGVGAFDPTALDDLPRILEDVLYEQEEEKRLLAEEAAARDDAVQGRSFLDTLGARLAGYAAEYDPLNIVAGETPYKLSELDIDFPTQWSAADYLKGRDWWIRRGEGDDGADDDDQDTSSQSLELERYLRTKPFETYALYRGRHDADPAKSTLRCVGILKAVIRIVEDDPSLYESSGEALVPKSALEARPYVVRLYVIKGSNLQPVDRNSCDPYLRVKLGASQVDRRPRHHKTRTVRPDFYETFEFQTELPGPSVLKIQVKDWNRFYPVHELVGETRIDLEDRWFHRDWQLLDQPDPASASGSNKLKPIEVRDLVSVTKDGLVHDDDDDDDPHHHHERKGVVQGQLMCWVEIRPARETREPPVVLEAPPKREFEVRIICWRTKDVPFDMGDYYCQFWIGSTGKSARKQSTDIHWRCQNGRASWNWRIKIPVELPFDNPEDGRLTVQLWDQDVIKWNDVIGEAQLDLYKWFLKAYREEHSVQVFKVIHDAIKRKRRDEMGLADSDEEGDDFEDDSDDDEGEEEDGEEEEEGVENPLRQDEGDLEEGLLPPEEANEDQQPAEDDNKKKKRKRRKDDEADVSQQPTKVDDAEQKDAEFLVKQLKEAVGLGDLDETAQWVHMTYHNRARRRVYSRGAVAISVEILPKEEAELRPAGHGISAPNMNPVLPPRTGRLSFSLNPFTMLTALCGPKVATMICCALCLALFLFIWFYVGLYFDNLYTMYQAAESL